MGLIELIGSPAWQTSFSRLSSNYPQILPKSIAIMALTLSESLPSEGNVRLDVVEIDETTTSSDEATSEASQADSQHSQT